MYERSIIHTAYGTSSQSDRIFPTPICFPATPVRPTITPKFSSHQAHTALRPRSTPQMGTDVMLQFGILIFTLGIFYLLQYLPKRALSNLRSKTRPNIQANRHLLAGAQFLIRARSVQNKKSSASFNLAKSAAAEADKALAIQPREPAAHILRAMALDIMGHKNAALKSLDVALSPTIVKGLSEKERGDALFKRAELQLALNRRRRVDSAVLDLAEAVKLSTDNSKAFCLLGQCYETKNLKDDAKSAFKKALEIEPGLVQAREGLARLGP